MRKILIPECKDCITACKCIFSSLSNNEINTLTYNKNCSLYKKGSVIFNEGTRIHNIYCINSGIVKLYKTGIEGKEQIIGFAKKGNIVGYRSILSKEPACSTAKVIEDVTLCSIPADSIFKLINKNTNFSINVISLACKELGEANQFLMNIAQKTVRERLAEAILKLKYFFNIDNDGFIQVSLSREEIASLIGTATETVIRLLSEFKKDKYIEMYKRKIKILQENKLKEISND